MSIYIVLNNVGPQHCIFRLLGILVTIRLLSGTDQKASNYFQRYSGESDKVLHVSGSVHALDETGEDDGHPNEGVCSL